MHADKQQPTSGGNVPTLYLTKDLVNGFVMGVCGLGNRDYANPDYLIHDEAVRLPSDIIQGSEPPERIFNKGEVERLFSQYFDGKPRLTGADVPVIEKLKIVNQAAFQLSDISIPNYVFPENEEFSND
jgi:hypothetical protein